MMGKKYWNKLYYLKGIDPKIVKGRIIKKQLVIIKTQKKSFPPNYDYSTKVTYRI